MKKILFVILGILAIFVIIFAWFFVRIWIEGKADPKKPADALIVLGAAQYYGKPSPVLKARLDEALVLYNKKMASLIITTGGKLPGEKFSEGATGKTYLIEQGIAEKNIIAEEQSETTKQHLMRVSEIAKERNIKSIIIVSDPFHLYRAEIIAHDLGFNTQGAAAASSPISQNAWLEFRYMLRETILTLLHIFFDA